MKLIQYADTDGVVRVEQFESMEVKDLRFWVNGRYVSRSTFEAVHAAIADDIVLGFSTDYGSGPQQ